MNFERSYYNEQERAARAEIALMRIHAMTADVTPDLDKIREISQHSPPEDCAVHMDAHGSCSRGVRGCIERHDER